jgi:hypothetical protein
MQNNEHPYEFLVDLRQDKLRLEKEILNFSYTKEDAFDCQGELELELLHESLTYTMERISGLEHICNV